MITNIVFCVGLVEYCYDEAIAQCFKIKEVIAFITKSIDSQIVVRLCLFNHDVFLFLFCLLKEFNQPMLAHMFAVSNNFFCSIAQYF